MNKIYQCEDSIEHTKFLLSALKIEYGFLNIHNLARKKITNYHHHFLFKLKLSRNRNLLHQCEQRFNQLADALSDLMDNKKRNAFHTLLTFSEKQERRHPTKTSRDRSEQLRRSKDRSQFGGELAIKSVSVIEEENWQEKMTIEELQASCDYYSIKIKEVETSFSEFFHVIKNE